MKAGISTTTSASTRPIRRASTRADFGPLTATGIAGTVAGTGFVATNVKWSINGYLYGNMPLIDYEEGRSRALVRDHTRRLQQCPHAALAWQYDHVAGQRTDVLNIMAAQMITADMVPDAAGIWLLHCHISDHMLAGMIGRYEVRDR